MKMPMMFAALLVTSSTGLACTDTGAFGVQFGTPVPKDADEEMHRGGSVPNAMGCFYGTVPAPFPGFDKYAYCANRDRKTVYALEGYVVIDGGRKIWDGDDVKEKARAIVSTFKQNWAEKFGFKFEQDFPSNVLTWTAETDTLSAHISVDGQYVIVECTNRMLEGKAFAAGLKTL
jgi:hypothetical protein